jgi:quinolinate synthase
MHPDALFMAHPECRPEVIKLADAVTSTSGMLKYASESAGRSFIVGTEVGMLHPLKKANPDKEFYPASESMVCYDMKKISLKDIVHSLETMEGEVKVPEDIRLPALKAVKGMVNLSGRN